MKKSFIAALLVFAACTGANAAVVYSWQATCLQRTYSDGPTTTELGCTGPATGFVEMPPGYIPGQRHDSPALAIWFTIIDEVFIPFIGSSVYRELVQASMRMPETVGVPEWDMSTPNMLSRASVAGLRYGTELRLGGPNGVQGFVLRGSDITARLLPEPHPAALIGVALACLMLTRRRRAPAAA